MGRGSAAVPQRPSAKILENPYEKPKSKRKRYISARSTSVKPKAKSARFKEEQNNILPARPSQTEASLQEPAIALPKSEELNRLKPPLPKLRKIKPAEEQIKIVNDVIVITKHYLSKILEVDSQEESVYRINLDHAGLPKVVVLESEPANPIRLHQRFARDYLLIDMREESDFLLCRIHDCRDV